MPLSRIPSGRLRCIALPALVVYVIAVLPFVLVDELDDMVGLQLAWSESEAREIVADWSDGEVVDMAFLQGADALHALALGLLLGVAAVWAGRRIGLRASHWAPIVAWMAVAAAVIDTLENVGMIVMIRGNVDDPVPAITTVLAVAKFSILLAVLLYVLGGITARLRRSSSSPRP
ncbi:MAG: hypothetical protein M3277_12460 [Actinomycetota bacterium]|nr:hypothetical protein [Actinomycetota bacterium]